MKSTIVIPTLAVLLLLITGCDTPWAAAQRKREGITWSEWRQGIRSKQEKEQAKIASQNREETEREFDILTWKKQRSNYLTVHPHLPNEIVQAINNGRLARGMTETQVALAWAVVPTSVNTSTGSWGERRQCVYEFKTKLSRDLLDNDWYARRYYLYFQNGQLDSWQSSR